MTTFLSFLSESSLSRLRGITDLDVKNAFFANYLAAMLMMRTNNTSALRLVNDSSHSTLSRFSSQMSDLNFWGRALFYPDVPEVRTKLAFGAANSLKADAGRMLSSRVNWLMRIPMANPNQVDWNEVVSALLLLKHRFSLQSTHFNNVVYALHKWNDIGESAKRRALHQGYMYLMQSDPRSSLVGHLRQSASSTGWISKLVVPAIAAGIIIRKLREDGDGGSAATDGGSDSSGVGEIGTSDNGVLPNMISRHEVGVVNNVKLVKKAPFQVKKHTKIVFRGSKPIKKRSKRFKPNQLHVPSFLTTVN